MFPRRSSRYEKEFTHNSNLAVSLTTKERSKQKRKNGEQLDVSTRSRIPRFTLKQGHELKPLIKDEMMNDEVNNDLYITRGYLPSRLLRERRLPDAAPLPKIHHDIN